MNDREMNLSETFDQDEKGCFKWSQEITTSVQITASIAYCQYSSLSLTLQKNRKLWTNNLPQFIPWYLVDETNAPTKFFFIDDQFCNRDMYIVYDISSYIFSHITIGVINQLFCGYGYSFSQDNES